MKAAELKMLLLLVATVWMTGCGRSNAELIVGKWRVEQLTNARFDVPPEVLGKISSGLYLEFSADKKFLFSGYFDTARTGKYTVDEGGLFTVTADDGKMEQTDTINELTKSRFIFTDHQKNKWVCTK
jgi:hypothetical protein